MTAQVLLHIFVWALLTAATSLQFVVFLGKHNHPDPRTINPRAEFCSRLVRLAGLVAFWIIFAGATVADYPKLSVDIVLAVLCLTLGSLLTSIYDIESLDRFISWEKANGHRST